MAPPHARSRRRQQQQRPRKQPNVVPATGPTETLEPAELTEAPIVPAVPQIAQVAVPAPTPRRSRRASARPEPEPIDYSRDYRHAGRDLKIIMVLALILTAGMIALRFSGLL
jgi:hypothetical protein